MYGLTRQRSPSIWPISPQIENMSQYMGRNWFRRLILPGLAFKAIVIGGGYATGRELAEYFLPSGPRGGVAGMLLAMSIWSVVCATTFLFARRLDARDYRSFFQHLLGPFWFTFEWMYVLFLILVLSIFGAAAGAIGTAVFGWPTVLGTLLLMVGIALVTAFGNDSVERLFKWVSVLLYVTYVVFLALGLAKFGGRIVASFRMPTPTDGWAAGGLAYAGYNIVGAVVILPVVRHLRTNGDALRAGLLAGPLAIVPALLFFICMCAYYPQAGLQVLPSDFLLRQLNIPALQVAFQIMIFSALLESGTG